MILETERLILREYTMADFDGLYAILSDPITMQHYPKPYDEKGTMRWLRWSLENYKQHGFGWWAIILKETGEFIGDCGITMQPIDWRKGYGSEAARAVRDWGFQNTEFDALYSYMTSANVASYSTAQAAGLRFVKEYLDEGEPHRVYTITRQEWLQLNQNA